MYRSVGSEIWQVSGTAILLPHDGDRVQLRQLLDRPSIILLIGRPASGKTTALKAIIHQIVKMKKPSFGRFCVSTKYSGDFNFATDENVFEDYTQAHLEEYVLKIKAWKKRTRKRRFHRTF